MISAPTISELESRFGSLLSFMTQSGHRDTGQLINRWTNCPLKLSEFVLDDVNTLDIPCPLNMKAMHRRVRTILLLAVSTTLLAGYVGLVFLPSAFVLWLGAVFLLPIVAVAPVLVGAQIAWPVTCVALPLTAMVVRPATAWAPLFFSIVGAGSGLISAKTSVPGAGYGSSGDLLWTCALSGALLGVLFGYAMWRFDVLSQIDVETTGSLQTAIKTDWPSIALPVVFIAVALIYLALSAPINQPALDRNGMTNCTEKGGKLSPRQDKRGFACVGPHEGQRP